MGQVILIKYGELGTKKGNRTLFIQKLYQNIKYKLKDEAVTIKKDYNRLYLYLNNDNEIEVINKLKLVFGIHQIVMAVKIKSDLQVIKDKALELCQALDFKSFKVVTKRVDKNFPFSSMEVNQVVGAFILERLPHLNVDVHTPELTLKIEIRTNNTYLYHKEIPGLGGYPVGIQGRGLLMLSGGIDSPVAGYLSLKRGLTLDCIYFDSPPHTSKEATMKVIKLAQKLKQYDGEIKLHLVPFTKMQMAIYENVTTSYMVTIMRRMMYLISVKFLKKINGHALITGESIGQVASQTLTSMKVINAVTNVPVIRPIACFDKLEIIALAQMIDTYDLSILPYQDCCTLFIPKHPVINPSLEKCLSEEAKFDYQQLLNECLDGIKTINLNEFKSNDV